MNLVLKLKEILNIGQSKQERSDSTEQLFLNKVIELLKTNPQNFSAINFGDSTSLNSYVISKDRAIMIDISGKIITPVAIKMSQDEKQFVKEVMSPIIKRDSNFLMNKIIQQ